MPESGHMKVISCTGQSLTATFKSGQCSEVVEGLSKQLANLGYEVATSNGSLFVLLSAPDSEEKAVRRAISDTRVHQRMTAQTKSSQSLRSLQRDNITHDDSALSDITYSNGAGGKMNCSKAEPTSVPTLQPPGFPHFEMTASHWDILLRVCWLCCEKRGALCVEWLSERSVTRCGDESW
jgi:hypothetical protein